MADYFSTPLWVEEKRHMTDDEMEIEILTMLNSNHVNLPRALNILSKAKTQYEQAAKAGMN